MQRSTLFADVTALHSAMLEKDPKDFVSHYIFEPIPYVFSGDFPAWIRWKTILAELLDVDPRDLVITGSGALGYSLNPHKNFKSFNEASDIDCGVVSPYHFELAWRYLRQLRPAWLVLPRVSKNSIKRHRNHFVFAGTIATDTILALLPFGKEWQAALDLISEEAPLTGREVKLRIYRDYDALRSYQALNIEKLRGGLGVRDDDNTNAIAVEE